MSNSQADLTTFGGESQTISSADSGVTEDHPLDTASERDGYEEMEPLPERYNGWVRDDDGDSIRYWRATSNHVQGAYECVSVSQHGTRSFDDAPSMSVRRRTYDQFGHNVGACYPTVGGSTPSQARRSLQKSLDQHAGEGDYESPPEMPTKIGEWELIDDSHDYIRWEYGFGEAEVIAEQTDILSRYQSTAYRYIIRYREIDTYPDGTDIVTDVSRTSAFEIAVNTMQQLDVPVGDAQAKRKSLQQINGVGPAKADSLLLLGVDSPNLLAAHISNEESVVNPHHEEAVEKILTTTIREHLS